MPAISMAIDDYLFRRRISPRRPFISLRLACKYDYAGARGKDFAKGDNTRRHHHARVARLASARFTTHHLALASHAGSL